MTAPAATDPGNEGVIHDDLPAEAGAVPLPDAAHWLEDHVGDSTDLPRGRKGLWGALTFGTLPGTASWMPTVDAAALGHVGGSMFDVDAEASIDLTAV